MAKREIRIVPKRRDEVDVRRLAEALLDLIDHLDDNEKSRLVAEGKRRLEMEKRGGRPKGSAA